MDAQKVMDRFKTADAAFIASFSRFVGGWGDLKEF